MRKQHSSKRRLSFENLENRTMLTGTVIASFAAGALRLIGDSSANSVQLSESGGTWTVQGQGTVITGGTTFTDVKSISAALGAGNDTLKISNGVLTGALDIAYTSADSGAKNTQLNTVTAGKTSIVNAAGGQNTIVINHLTTTMTGVVGVIVTTGIANDTIQLGSVNSATNLVVDAGNGSNYVAVTGVQTHGTLDDTITTGTGIDTVVVSAFTTTTNNLIVKSGDGTDSVVLNTVNVGTKNLTVDVGPGYTDLLSIISSTAYYIRLLDTGGHSGRLTGLSNHFTYLFIDANFTSQTGTFAAFV
jgi:hypothetical protein